MRKYIKYILQSEIGLFIAGVYTASVFAGVEFYLNDNPILHLIGSILLLVIIGIFLWILIPWLTIMKSFQRLFRKKKKRTVILFTDIVGYNALKAKDEMKANHLLEKSRYILKPLINHHSGKILKEIGDCTISSFDNVLDATQCALEIQGILAIDHELTLRIGIHRGVVWFVQDTVFGDGVYIAECMELLAQPGGICISESIYNVIRNQPGFETEFLGEKTLKNVDYPVKVFSFTGAEISARFVKPQQVKHIELSGFRKRLIWIVIPVVVFCLGIAGYVVYSHFYVGKGKVISIAILPFENLNPDEELDNICIGLPWSIKKDMNYIENLLVIDCSLFIDNTKGYSIYEIGKEFNVQYVLRGSIEKSGDRLLINAELINTDNGVLFWSDEYPRELGDVLDIRRDISNQIIKKLKIRLGEKERVLVEKLDTENSEAWSLYLKGRDSWEKRKELGYFKALEYFRQAVEKDPSYALAYVGISDVYSMMGYHGNMLPDEAYPLAKKEVNKALEINKDLGEAHTSLAFIYFYYDWNFVAAEREFIKAIELNPRYVLAHHWYKDLLLSLGRWDQAISEMKLCQEFDPLDKGSIKFLIVTYIIAGRYMEALDQYQKAVILYPDSPDPYDVISRLYVQTGRYDQALEVLNKARDLSGEPDFKEDVFAYIYALSGRSDEAQTILQKLISENKCTLSRIALIYYALGERDKAFEFLYKAYDARDSQLVYLKTFPEWSGLRSDPEFESLLKNIGLD